MNVRTLVIQVRLGPSVCMCIHACMHACVYVMVRVHTHMYSMCVYVHNNYCQIMLTPQKHDAQFEDMQV